MEIKVKIPEVEQVKKFVHICEKSAAEVDVKCGSYVVDGKSLLGVMSLNLSSDLTVLIHGPEDAAATVRDEIKAAGMLA